MSRSVLVIEDNAGIVEALREILTAEGYQVAAARDGQAALEWLAANPAPDVILLDIMMPRMDGPTFRARQLATPAIAHIPTFVLTAGPVGGEQLREMRLAGVMRKPLQIEVLLAALEPFCAPAPAPDHLVLFYQEDEQMLAKITSLLGGGLRNGGVAVAVITPAHAARLRALLAAGGLDTDGLEASGRLTLADAAFTLSAITGPDGTLDFATFAHVAGTMVERAAALAPDGPVCLFGEMVDLLWRRGDHGAALHLEHFWSELQRRRRFSLACAYRASPEVAASPAFAEVRAHHAAAL